MHSSEIDWRGIHGWLYKKCHNSNLAWECLNEAWTILNEEIEAGDIRTTREQASFLMLTAWRRMMNEFKRRRKYINQSQLEDRVEEGIPESIIDIIHGGEQPDINNTELQLIRLAISKCDDDLIKPIIFIMDKIFEGHFKTAIKPEAIRNVLKYSKNIEMRNVSNISRRVYEEIIYIFG
jgi:hypothetical protein